MGPCLPSSSERFMSPSFNLTSLHLHPVTSPEPAVSQHNLSAEARLMRGSGADKACPWVSQEGFWPYYCCPFSRPMPPEKEGVQALREDAPADVASLTLPRQAKVTAQLCCSEPSLSSSLFAQILSHKCFWGQKREENKSAVNWHVRVRTRLAKLFSLGSWPNPSHMVTSRLPKVSQNK